MPDEQKKDVIPKEFDDVADESVEAGIADEVAGYDRAMKNDPKPESTDARSPDEMGDFA